MSELPHAGLPRVELERIASELPADLLTAEVLSRGADFVGQLTVAAANATAELLPISYEDRMFKRNVGNFLDPDEQIGLQDQLELMHDFWQRLGITPPTLNDTQMGRLAWAVDRYPDRRIVPTPLMIVEDRVAIAEKGRELPGQQLRTDDKVLWVPGTEANYGKVLLNPDGIVTDATDGSVKYGLRYKSPNDDIELLDRIGYKNQLISSGRVLLDDYGTLWMYPITDVRVDAQRTTDDKTAGDIFREVSPFLRPELLLTIQLLHQANGTPNPDWSQDIANEAMYKVDEQGNAVSLVRVNGTRWEPTERYIRSGGVDENVRSARLGKRATDSALVTTQ